jgi:hypothetical protein
MAVSRAERRSDREAAVADRFGSEDASAVLDLLELVELAWHDCYADVSPPERVVDDILVCSEGDWRKLIGAARLAITDARDLRLAADELRRKR